jgi:nitrate reductase NapD
MSEFNVCGVLVMAAPKSAKDVESKLNSIEGVEVHHNENGKLVVTIEGPHNREFANTMSSFSDIKGVLSTSLVYHEIDSQETVNNQLNEPSINPAVSG